MAKGHKVARSQGHKVEEKAEAFLRGGAAPVAGQVQVGDIGKEDGRVGGNAGQSVVVEAQRLEAGHVPEPLPGEGGQEVSIQPQLPQGLEVDEAAGVDGGHRVVGEPQEAQLRQVVEGCPGNPGDQAFLQAQFDRVRRDVDGDGGDSGVAALHRPAAGKTLSCNSCIMDTSLHFYIFK